jgi:hypothetical protein
MSEENNLDDFEFDGMSPLEQDAANMHEMFLALMKAGFTERQGLQLVAFLIDRADENNDVNIHIDGDIIHGDMRLETDDDSDNP